jgi:hypothetical protein
MNVVQVVEVAWTREQDDVALMTPLLQSSLRFESRAWLKQRPRTTHTKKTQLSSVLWLSGTLGCCWELVRAHAAGGKPVEGCCSRYRAA